ARHALLAALLDEYAGRAVTDTVGGDLRVVAAGQGRHHLDRLVAEQERLLDDRGVNRTVGDALQRGVVLIEADDLDLPYLVLVLDGAADGRRIVRPQADHANRLLLVLKFGDGIDGVLLGLLRPFRLIQVGAVHPIFP